MIGQKAKKKECKAGFPCGNSCQSRDKKCRSKLSEFGAKAQAWLKENSQGSFQLSQGDKAKVKQVKQGIGDAIQGMITELTGKDNMTAAQRTRINTKKLAREGGISESEAEPLARVLYFWTESSYEDLRHFDRTGKLKYGEELKDSSDPDDQELYQYYTKEAQADIQRLNQIIETLPKHKGTVSRGIKLPPDQVEGFLSSFSKPTELEALSSFTSDPKISEYFANLDADSMGMIPIVITVPNGQTGVDISKYSRHRSEKEILYPKGVKFQATKSPRLTKYTDGTYRIDLELREV